ncbi:hypothetical protein [Sphingomonas sp.]|uniref:hypothetical protein n=1 Tax=Sphingomonas sp. TaxID=28214 RepID=UPI002DD6A220|nr:hypothetical protein [Sphingomonas sp.]
MDRRIAALAGALFASCIPAVAPAQSAPAPAPAAMPLKAETVADVRYFMIETMTSKPGARTWTIISKNFIPAAKAAGVPYPVIYTETGTLRTIAVTPLTGGLADLEWSMSPDDVKLMTELGRQLGNADKAEALMKEFNDGIDSRSREIVHEHTK